MLGGDLGFATLAYVLMMSPILRAGSQALDDHRRVVDRVSNQRLHDWLRHEPHNRIAERVDRANGSNSTPW